MSMKMNTTSIYPDLAVVDAVNSLRRYNWCCNDNPTCLNQSLIMTVTLLSKVLNAPTQYNISIDLRIIERSHIQMKSSSRLMQTLYLNAYLCTGA